MPWAELMMIGLGVLRLAPPDFWAMTLPELEAAAGGLHGPLAPAAPLVRADLRDLMARFPDAELTQEEAFKWPRSLTD
ncbi:MAG: phage tail assembly chaperone [Hyphomicrobiales bacterium]